MLLIKLLLVLVIAASLVTSAVVLGQAKTNAPILGKDPPNIGYVAYTINLGLGENTEPAGIDYIAYDPSNGYLYVTECTSNAVAVINPSTNQVIATIEVGPCPYDIIYDPNNGYLYVTNSGSNTVSVINPTTNTVIATISLPIAGAGPMGITYDPSNGYLYVACNEYSNAGYIVVIDPMTNTVVGTIQVEPASSLWGITYDPSNGYLYVTGLVSNIVYVINPETNTLITTIPVGSIPINVIYDPSNGYLYVTTPGVGSDAVYVINGETNTVIATIPIGPSPLDIAYDPVNGYIYVTAGLDTVTVIDPTTNTVVGNITVGLYPQGIVYDPSNGYLYVVNLGSGTVSVIATTSEIAEYPVTFIESGLPSGTTWSVTINGNTETSTTNEITFTLPPGTYTYTIGSVPGYTASPSSGMITVTSSGITQTITFTPITYTVTFVESGLPSGASWSVTVNGVTETSTTSEITFTLPSGTYTYTIGSVPGYTASPSSGVITVSGNEVININFAAVTSQPTIGRLEVISYSVISKSPTFGYPTYGQPLTLAITVKNVGSSTVVIHAGDELTFVGYPAYDAYGYPIILTLTATETVTIPPGQTATIYYVGTPYWHIIAPQTATQTIMQGLVNLAYSATTLTMGSVLSEAEQVLNPTMYQAFTIILDGAESLKQSLSPLSVLAFVKLMSNNAFVPVVQYTYVPNPAPVCSSGQVSVCSYASTSYTFIFPGNTITLNVIIPATKILATIEWPFALIRAIAGSIAASSLAIESIPSCTTIVGCLVPAALLAVSAFAVPVTNYVYQNLIADPSINYTQIVQPAPLPPLLASLPVNNVTLLLRYEFYYYSYLNASLESYVRGYGALLHNNTYYAQLQFYYAYLYAQNASYYYNLMMPLLQNLMNEIASKVNQTTFEEGVAEIKAHGLPANVTNILASMGLLQYINVTQIESESYTPVNVSIISNLPNLGEQLATITSITIAELNVSYVKQAISIPPPSSYFYLKVVAPDYANWTVYTDASDSWYASYSGTGSMSFGPAYVGQPGTTVTFNVTSLGNCPSPSITYEPSNTLSLNNGANYETIVINCQPMLSVDFNVTGGGGVIALINEPGLGVKQLMLNGPTNYAITVPMNTTVTIYTWPNPGYTLRGIYINGTGVIYTENMFGTYTYEETINKSQTITIEFSGNT